jgi:hypothetical protein
VANQVPAAEGVAARTVASGVIFPLLALDRRQDADLLLGAHLHGDFQELLALHKFALEAHYGQNAQFVSEAKTNCPNVIAFGVYCCCL